MEEKVVDSPDLTNDMQAQELVENINEGNNIGSPIKSEYKVDDNTDPKNDGNVMYPNASISSVANTTQDDVSPGLPLASKNKNDV